MRNSDIPKDVYQILGDINRKYKAFTSFPSDKLRQEVLDISKEICSSSDKQKSMDAFLPDVYAIVKETARRLSEGPFIVTANENDIRLAEENDFVAIEGNKAVYSNRWDVGGHIQQWNMVHYDEQILGGILLHRGYAVQMATGEGKTLVATLPVFLNALTHDGVHLMTSNEYLSVRDYMQMSPLYLIYGLSVSCIELSQWGEVRHKKAYGADITFGSNSTFVFDYLRDHISLDPGQCVQSKHSYAIVDELDSAFIDSADEPHIIGGGHRYNEGKIYKDSIDIVKEMLAIDDGDMYNSDPLKKTCLLSEKGERWLAEKVGDKALYDVSKVYEIEHFQDLPDNEKEKINQRLRLQNVFNQLLTALTTYERDVDYVVEGGMVKIIDPYTGRVKESNRWEHGLHTAIEVKESVKVQDDFDGLAVISVKNYFKLYDKVSGMSGTILPVADELSSTYGLHCAAVPTHKPLIRKDNPLKIFRTVAQKDSAIIDDVIASHYEGRPVLVGCSNVLRAEAVGKLLQAQSMEINILDAKTTSEEAELIAKAGIEGAVTVATSVAGRGTDIKPSDAAIRYGGLRIVGADISSSIRIDDQLRGRSGRQGNPGSSVFYVSLEDQILRFLTDDENERMHDIAEHLSDSELEEDEDVRRFFLLAQENSDAYHKESRDAISRKDDIIAPYRRRFYERRNEVLYDAESAEKLVADILDSRGISNEAVNSHLMQLYGKVRALLGRSEWNNSIVMSRQIPFSVNGTVYAIELDIRRIRDSFDYFCGEYMRQVVLLNYDRMWGRLVLYILGDLDKKEIDGLEERYLMMYDEVEAGILACMTAASVPFGDRITMSAGSNIEKRSIDRPRTAVRLDPESPCPCGSGKKYRDCHGASHDKISARRRRR